MVRVRVRVRVRIQAKVSVCATASLQAVTLSRFVNVKPTIAYRML